MFTYQVRPRIFRHKHGDEIKLPADCEIQFHLRPLQSFGCEAGNGRTLVRNEPAKLLFNANSGEHFAISQSPLPRLDVTINESGGRIVQLSGNVLSVQQHFTSLRELEETLISVYFAFPALLNVSFADPPFVERVDGTVGSVGFRWELDDFCFLFETTTLEKQESSVCTAWERMGCVSEARRGRLIAALHFFHVACRLNRQGSTPGEFMAEAVLNFSKVLEVLFPADGDGKSRDAARAGLKRLEFTEAEIEGSFIPAMALRNEIGVGHTQLGLFTMEQLRVIHAYTAQAETAFRKMFDRLLKAIEAGPFDVEPHVLESASPTAVAIVERIKEYLPKQLLEPTCRRDMGD
jgi:hypothetical protein